MTLEENCDRIFPAGRGEGGVYLRNTAGPAVMALEEIEAVAEVVPPGGRILEMGTWCGSCAAVVADRRRDVEIVCVDSFVGHSYGPLLWWVNARRNMRLFVGRTDEFAAIVMSKTFAAVIVDADHSREGTLRDLRFAARLVVADGVILAHDYGDPNWPGVGEGVAEFIAESPWRIARLVRNLAILRLSC